MQELTQNLIPFNQSTSRQTRSTLVPSQRFYQSNRLKFSCLQSDKYRSNQKVLLQFEAAQSFSRSDSYSTVRSNIDFLDKEQSEDEDYEEIIHQQQDQREQQFQSQQIMRSEVPMNDERQSINGENSIIRMRRSHQRSEVRRGLQVMMKKINLGKQETPKQSQQVKSLNQRLFGLKGRLQDVLYTTNFLVNTFIRVSIIFILVEMILNHKNYYLMQFVLVMEIVSVLIYTIAMSKLIHTKSDSISVYFQKYFYDFYDKQYLDIHMDRIFRKHFTPTRFKKNFITFLNPRTKFKMNTKISLMRQQIFKRIELVLCIIPFAIIFLTNTAQFQFEGWDSRSYVGFVIVIEAMRTSGYYLTVFVAT